MPGQTKFLDTVMLSRSAAQAKHLYGRRGETLRPAEPALRHEGGLKMTDQGECGSTGQSIKVLDNSAQA